MKKVIEKLLYKSFDAPLSIKEADLLANALKNSAELKEELSHITEIRNVAGKGAYPDFKPFFEERLLNKLYSKEKIVFSFNIWINSLSYSFRNIAVAAIIVLILLVSYNIKNGNIYSIANLLGKSDPSIEYAFDPIQNLIGSNR